MAENPNLVLGWHPMCECNPGKPTPAVVLDPFMGSGTVGVVATRLGRNFVGVDLKPEYVKMANTRICRALSSSLGRVRPPSFGDQAENFQVTM